MQGKTVMIRHRRACTRGPGSARVFQRGGKRFCEISTYFENGNTNEIRRWTRSYNQSLPPERVSRVRFYEFRVLYISYNKILPTEFEKRQL